MIKEAAVQVASFVWSIEGMSEKPREPFETAISSVEAAAAYLDGLINREKDPNRGPRMNLDPARRLLAGLGDPQNTLSVVHVAGSKGKGSTCLLAEAVLRAAGESVGCFTSPHLSRWTERFRIDGCEVDGAELATAIEQLRPLVEERRASPDLPSFFDATTAAALLLFARARVDRAILEVGLGGRLDSTNVVSPAVTAITSIELEHTEFLGETLAEIAGEKAGIIKAGVPCVMGRLPGEAASVVEARAAALGAPLARLGKEFDVEIQRSDRECLAIRYSESDGFSLDAELPLLGDHHASNAAVALASLRQLKSCSDDAFRAASRQGLADARLPGRVEVLERDPWIVVDSAHTQASARALRAALDDLPFARAEFVLSVSAGKDLDRILELLLPLAARVCFTRADPDRSLDPNELAAAALRIDPKLESQVVHDPRLALSGARERIAEGELLCVTGSVYLAGIARSLFLEAGPLGT